MRQWNLMSRASNAIVVCFLILIAGCSGAASNNPSVMVQGNVTYQGKPVEEGTVNFYDSKQGTGGSAEIESGGSYKTATPIVHGNYEVSINPPLEEKEMKGSMPSMQPKEMANIPPKYRNGKSSGFKATVSGSETEFDFNME